MKKIIGGLLFLLTALAAYPQTSGFQPEWAFGANAGATLSRVGFVPKVPQTWLIQESGGLTARYISESNIGIQVELNYSLRGWKERSDTLAHSNEYSRSLAYLELPLMTHFYGNMGKWARFVFNVGPQIGYNTGEKELDRKIDVIPEPNYYDKKIQHHFDYGITGGLGIEIRSGVGSFILEGRYYYGLADIFNSERNPSENYFQASHNQAISIKLTYLMGR